MGSPSREHSLRACLRHTCRILTSKAVNKSAPAHFIRVNSSFRRARRIAIGCHLDLFYVCRKAPITVICRLCRLERVSSLRPFALFTNKSLLECVAFNYYLFLQESYKFFSLVFLIPFLQEPVEKGRANNLDFFIKNEHISTNILSKQNVASTPILFPNVALLPTGKPIIGPNFSS